MYSSLDITHAATAYLYFAVALKSDIYEFAWNINLWMSVAFRGENIVSSLWTFLSKIDFVHIISNAV